MSMFEATIVTAATFGVLLMLTCVRVPEFRLFGWQWPKEESDPPDAERCIWCGDLADGRYGRRNPLSMCADHGLRQLQLDDSERIEDF